MDLRKYKHTFEEMDDCFYYKVQVGNYRIDIEEDKFGNDNFFSVKENGELKKILFVEDINDIYEYIKDLEKNYEIKKNTE